MKALITTLLLIAFASPSFALSCLRPDPIETFERLAAAEETYFVIYGQFTFDEDALPQGVNSFEQTEDPDPIPAWFDGLGLSRVGFVTPYRSHVQLEVTCAGPWCGSARNGGQAVYFVPATDSPVTLQAGPCGGMIFDDPAPAVLEMLTSCMQGGSCEPLPFE